MLVSTKGRYGLRMMIDLASQADKDRVSLREIGERQGISAKYLEQLARALCSAGMLRGVRGQGGGYTLAMDPEDIRVGDILRATEGSVAPIACLASPSMACPRLESCETHAFFSGLEKVIDDYVDGFTLADLLHTPTGDELSPLDCVGLAASHD